MGFSDYRRQSIKSLFVIFPLKIKLKIKLLWYFIPMLFFRRESSDMWYLFYGVITFILLLCILQTVIRYRTFKFKLVDGRFMVKYGILNKTELTIPLHKIVNVHLRKGMLHQVIDGTQLEVETAGSESKEISIECLSNRDAILLKKELLKENLTIVEENECINYLQKITLKDLFWVALSENHLGSLLYILAFVYGLYENFSELIGVRTKNLFYESGVFLSSYFKLYIVLISIFLALAVSFARVFIKHFNLKTVLKNGAIEISQGLIDYRNTVINTNRIQYLNIYSNIFKRILGIHGIVFSEVISGKVNKKNLIRTVGVTKAQLNTILEVFFSKNDLEFCSAFKRPHRYYKFVLFVRGLLLMLILDFILYRIGFYWDYILLINGGVLLFVVLGVLISYKNASFNYNDSHIQVNSGLLALETKYFNYFKIQQITLRQGFFQKRRGIADLILETASQKIKIPCIRYSLAIELYNKFLARAEKTNKKWM